MNRNKLKDAFPKMPDDCYQAMMSAAHSVQEETVVKKKVSLALVMALVLVLAAGVALALATWRDAAREIVVVEQESGYFEEWPTEKKIALVGALVENGYTEKTAEIDAMLTGKLPESESEQIADAAMMAFTGREISEISFMEIMTSAWGPFSQWTLEEQAWYSQLMVEMNLQGADHTLYVMPEGPVDEAQAIAIGRKAIAGALNVPESTLDDYALTTTFQVPESIEPGDNQPYWQIEYWVTEDTPEEGRLFPISFWVFVHPETGALMEPAEELAEALRAAQVWEEDPLHLQMSAFDEKYGVYWQGTCVEAKAEWSRDIAPQIRARAEEFTDTYGLLAKVVFDYGVPDDLALLQEEAYALAERTLVEKLGLKEEEIRFYTFRQEAYYDITDPDKPLWKFFFQGASIYHSDKSLADAVRDYYGEEHRVAHYKVELDARTGEVIRAFPVDFADIDSVETMAETM